MRCSESRRVGRAENARPVGTSAWCFSPGLDNVEDRTRPATLAGARNLKLDRLERVILQNHASQVFDVDGKHVSVEPVFVTENQIRYRVQSQGECHIDLPETSLVTNPFACQFG
jgi:hypothetical protein